ncbi:MAG: cytochrome c oxidase subunit 3 [Flavobacteriales bacterium]|nr:cytochrome c oxidase subunit 3 [Flavobacteriales bacterium]MCB9336095.1 cytochrome c oxidase subunit 3 [Flavobacteriales bacterium]
MTTITVDNINSRAELKRKTAKPLLWIGIMSIVMFFGGWTSAVIVSKGSISDWLSIHLPNAFYVSSVIIVLSSIFFHLGYLAIKKDQKKTLFIFVLLTLLSGFGFVISQYLGWKTLYENGIVATGSSSTNASSYLYLITFFHVLHLLAGLISLIVVSVKSKKERYSSSNFLGVELSLIYWHFLGALWIYLFIFLKYIA